MNEASKFWVTLFNMVKHWITSIVYLPTMLSPKLIKLLNKLIYRPNDETPTLEIILEIFSSFFRMFAFTIEILNEKGN